MATLYRYRIDVTYQGYNPEFDSEIIAAVGGHRNWAGAGFGFGTRDVGFVFKTKRGFENSLKRLKKARLHVSVDAYDLNDCC